MILDIGEKVLVIERPSYQDDLRRHFLGEVKNCTENAIRANGYAYVWNTTKGLFVRKPEKRERVIFPGELFSIIVLPPEVDLEEIHYATVPRKGLVVTDGKKFSLEISEFVAMR